MCRSQENTLPHQHCAPAFTLVHYAASPLPLLHKGLFPKNPLNANYYNPFKLETLIEDISSWSDLEARIAGLPAEIDRGNVFEEFCHAFFLLDPVFQFKEVYRQKEIPPRLSLPVLDILELRILG